MTFQKSNLIHATASILISLWLYFDAMNKDFGLLVPLLCGVVLLSLNDGIKYENLYQSRAAFVITILSSIFVIYTGFQKYHSNEPEQSYSFGVLALTSILSIIVFIFFRGTKHIKSKS
jgi:hypothetical protein